MLASKLYSPTLREIPADAEIASHQYMLKAGMIRKNGGGLYSFLPLGRRVELKIEAIVREEMENIGAQEIMMPIMQPAEIWHESGRWNAYGPEMFKLEDRHGNHFCLGPTHEELITTLVGGVVYGELSSQRIYANGTQLGALLGGVDDSGKGVAGVESMENSALTGTDGYVIYQQGNGGEEIPGTLTGSQEAVNGSDVALTLDHDVDWYVKQALLEGQKKTKATWAMAVVQDIQTGEILALEDTDEYQAGSDQAKLNASRAVSESFEPGSVGKIITMSGLLQTGLHKATDKFTVPYSYTKDGQAK